MFDLAATNDLDPKVRDAARALRDLCSSDHDALLALVAALDLPEKGRFDDPTYVARDEDGEPWGWTPFVF